MVSNIILRCFITTDYRYILKAYITYVMPLIEYGSSVWNPGTNCTGLQK